ncbi:phosphoenolpyruvate carboxylase, partial [Kouleothrix aurantiaca]
MSAPPLTNGERLSATIRLLGDALGQVIREQAGDAAYALEERVRKLTKAMRAAEQPEEASDALQAIVSDLSVGQARDLLKSFGTYFALVNLSEQLQRLWVLQERAEQNPNAPRTESIAAAVAELKRNGVEPAELQQWLNSALVLPVFTAHPTEARRRTTLEKLRRLAVLVERRLAQPNADELHDLNQRISEEVVGLWQSDEVRVIRPTVLDEVKNGLYYFEATLFNVIPELYRDLERALVRHYPDHRWHVPPILRFGSWMGGD